jgi:hypothetical protein
MYRGEEETGKEKQAATTPSNAVEAEQQTQKKKKARCQKKLPN